ncbi:hypothetical protein QQX09_07800 [Demequina sp. SYSU T00192]|uniref:Lipoprotein n=1 Tax=Demequina litoralis TaxID=3051660 RepID=A0ABT8G9F1_9MICO|nr:DUF6318 family protein [Demequina sp. SYSU T00192]MDN4475757.1 hypothetical protein [Demequina sp. SYSU T00192]
MRFIPGGRVARRAAAATMLAGVCVALAACTGETEPIVTVSPTSVAAVTPTQTPSSTPSPSSTALSDDELLSMMPEGAERSDVYGAMMTATFYAGLAGSIFATTDTAAWVGLAAPECDYCSSQAANVDALVASGDTAEGGEITIDQSSIRAALEDDGIAFVKLTGHVDPLDRISSSGQRTEAQSALETTFTMKLVFIDSLWRVSGVVTESAPA